MNKTKHILVTGAAGFIGFHVAYRLLKEGFSVLGIDSVNDYYDVNLKLARLKILHEHKGFTFKKINLADKEATLAVFNEYTPETVIHLAAQAGVRYSLTNPQAYVDSNIMGFVNVIEGARHNNVKHFLYASSSSVYGGNSKYPWAVEDEVNHPSSLYAATKRANELMAHSYSHLFKLPTTGLRFFTAYGPFGRPDMALFIFAKAIMDNKPVRLFNKGEMVRDITYIDDVVEAIFRLLDKPPVGIKEPTTQPHISRERFRLVNIGNQNPVTLKQILSTLENALGKKATVILEDIQLGDIIMSHADVANLKEIIGFTPETSIEEGIGEFAKWFKSYHK